MFKHYLISTWRNLIRNKLLSTIKILGLSIGIATFILGARYVQFEKSYDKHNSKYDRIYRIQAVKRHDRSDVWRQCCYPVTNYMQTEIPEVEKVSMFNYSREYFSTRENKVFFIDEGCFAGQEFLNIFDFESLFGDLTTALEKPNSILLSQTVADRIFPNENPVGKILLNEKKEELVVTAVYKDQPFSSHRKVAYILPFEPYHKHDLNNWGNFAYDGYALLNTQESEKHVNSKIQNILDNHLEHNTKEFFLQPLAKLHLQPQNSSDYLTVLYLTSSIILLILILSAVNYMNLSTAYSSIRSKEIGIRKVSGSSLINLRVQYLFESVLHALFAFSIAIILAKISITTFSDIVDRNLELNYFSNPGLLIITFLVTLLTAFVSGIYPALIMSSFKPVLVLKGLNPFGQGKNKSYGLKGMVAFQLILSAILIASSVWIFKNVNHLINKDLGFEKENLVRCRIPDNNGSTIKYATLKEQILQHPGIESVAISGNTPLCETWGTSIYFEGQDPSQLTHIRPNPTGKDYIETYNINLLFGRNFYEDFNANGGTCIVNETTINNAGWGEEAIGKWIHIWGEKHTIVGVMEDIITDDVHNELKPYILLPHHGGITGENRYTFRVNPNNFASSLKHIKSNFNLAFPGVIFDIYAYEDAIDDEAVVIWSSVRDTFGFFTIIAILIAVFGLFALITFSVQKRIKEIGVRKVQGSRVIGIYLLIFKEFLVLFAIAAIIAFPIPEILIHTMPGAYKYSMRPYDYIIIFCASLLMILLSGSYNVLKASMMNPVKALKYE